MKRNILTATIALILSLILFVIVSAQTTTAADTINKTTETVEATISEINIPSEIVIKKTIGGKVFTAEIIELKEIHKEAVGIKPSKPIQGKPSKPVVEPTTTPIFKEEATTQKVEETTTILEETTTMLEEETTLEINTETVEEITTSAPEIDPWAEKEAEYPVATYIWRYMKGLGWNDAVCAGVMGNIMAEVGGQTLNIKPYLYGGGGSYYGICQWYLPYTTRHIAGAGLEAQCDYLRDTVKKEMNNFGYKYSSSMNYSNFLNLSSPSEAAVAFAKCYERCASFSYGVRQSNAQKAYNYFVG